MNKPMFNMNFAPQQGPVPMAPVVDADVPAPPSFDDNLYMQLLGNEGSRPYPYKDTKGHLTIGIGYNLDDKDNQKILSNMGYNVKEVRSGKIRLTEPVIKALYSTSVAKATKDANQWIPNLSEQPENVQKAVIDMSFNLGATKLAGFVKTRAALISKDYKEASKQMLDSDWAGQVGKRANRLSDMVLSAQ